MNKPDYPFGHRLEKFRVMRHDCKDGLNCFEKNKRCRLGALDLWFPGNNGMSDLDGFCAINNHVLFLEWKTSGGITQMGPLLQLSHAGPVVIGVGPVELLQPDEWSAYHLGKRLYGNKEYPSEPACVTFDRFLWNWGQWALKNSTAWRP